MGQRVASGAAERNDRSDGREPELREHLHDVHLQLAERDMLIERLLAAPDAARLYGLEQERDRLRAYIADLEAHAQRVQAHADELRVHAERVEAHADARLAAMRATRVWRLASVWWRLKERVLGH